MILFVECHELDLYPGLKHEIFQMRSHGLRAICSEENLNDDNIDKDDLDDIAPSYLLCLEEKTGTVLGALRILQTMGPHTMSDLVYDIAFDEFTLRSPCLWEISRICVASDPGDIAKGYTEKKVVGELLVGAGELAKRCGITDYVMVMNAHSEALAAAAGYTASGEIGRGVLGKWGVSYCASVMSCNDETLTAIRQEANLDDGIWADDGIICRFSTEEDVLDLPASGSAAKVDPKAAADVKQRLQTYCADQLLSAKTDEERRDAYRLMRFLNRFRDDDDGRRAA